MFVAALFHLLHFIPILWMLCFLPLVGWLVYWFGLCAGHKIYQVDFRKTWCEDVEWAEESLIIRWSRS